MRRLVLLAALLLAAPVSAQVPHPHEDLVHHPLTIQSRLTEIQAINPQFIHMSSIGQSVGKFPIYKLEYVNPTLAMDPYALLHTPVYYLDANHHGNEHLGMEALLIFMEELAEWSKTPDGAKRLSEVRIAAVPMINPDGTGTDKRVNTKGVDLNRNYDYNWGRYGTSDMMHPLSGDYRGDAPLSEPETQANAELMANLRPDVYLSMHTGSHDIVLPWRQSADGDGPIPDWPLYEDWLGAIQNVSGLGHRGPSGAGESISYAYGMFGTLSLIVEVDMLQNEVLVEDMADTLKEEVAIFWDTLERMESLGAWLQFRDGMVTNHGLGPAYNVTLYEGMKKPQASENMPRKGTDREAPPGLPAPDMPSDVTKVLLAEVLAPGESVAVWDGLVTYERRLQGDEGRPVWQVFVKGVPAEVPDDAAETPLPVALVLAAVVMGLLLRRRPA